MFDEDQVHNITSSASFVQGKNSLICFYCLKCIRFFCEEQYFIDEINYRMKGQKRLYSSGVMKALLLEMM